MRTSSARLTRVETACSSAPAQRRFCVGTRDNRSRVTYANTPLALSPNSAIEIARKAKW